MKHSVKVLFISVLLLLTGCQAKLLRNDQAAIRQSVLNLYEEQLWDNLIRVHQNRPIVQIDYTDLTGLATNRNAGAMNVTDEFIRNRRRFAPGDPIGEVAQFSPTSVARDVINPTASTEQSIQLGIKGNPVTAVPGVYQAYIDFVAEEKLRHHPDTHPTKLLDGDGKPIANKVFVRETDSGYYYIPRQFERHFFQLFLTTTLQRAATSITAIIFPVRVASVDPSPEPTLSKAGTLVYRHRITVKEEVKNANGKAFIPTENGLVTVNVEPAATDAMTNKQLAIDEPTRTLVLVYDTGVKDRATADKRDLALLTALQKLPEIQMRLDNFTAVQRLQPVNPFINPIQDLSNQFELLRFQQELR